MRSLFAYMRTLTIPTAVFAATEDWSGGGLEGRLDRATSTPTRCASRPEGDPPK